MNARATYMVRLLLVALALLVGLVDTRIAFAQSQNCSTLASSLNSLNRNRDFRSLQRNTQQLREVAAALQDVESRFVRGGCAEALRAQQRLSRECRNLARGINRGRNDYNNLAARVETGQAVAQQRELTLQQIARFGCGIGSSGRVIETDPNQRSFGNLFDRLFGNGNDFVEDPFYDYGFGNMSTLRTVCVRKCDGYYWPVSFSTVGEYLQQDASQCVSQCPGSEVELYYYRNPGEDADDMVNLNGEPYRALENAFRYRSEYDQACTCKQQIDYGAVVISASTSDEQSRAMIEFNDLNFPLPQRDPRRPVERVVAEVIHVPLPRRRPVRPGEAAPVAPFRAPIASADLKTFDVGGKKVRLVGPDTPYVQSAAEGS